MTKLKTLLNTSSSEMLDILLLAIVNELSHSTSRTLYIFNAFSCLQTINTYNLITVSVF